MLMRSRAAVTSGVFCVAVMLNGCSRGSGPGEGSALELPEIRRLGRGGGPDIRALLLERVEQLAVAVTGPCEVRQGRAVLARGGEMREIVVTVLAGNPPRLQIGALACPPGPVEIVPDKPNSLRLRGGAAGAEVRRYDGRLRLVPRGGQTLDVINILHLEHYVPAVLEGELYPGWHIETYRAQAIAARTYALYQMQTFGLDHDYDLRSTEASQVYRGGAGIPADSKAMRAVLDTCGVVCSWPSPIGEKIFCTYFSSACGGRSQDAARVFNSPTITPLSGGVNCTYCRIGGNAYRWGPVRLSKSELTRLLVDRFPQYGQLGTIETIEAISWAEDGRPLRLRLRAAGGQSSEVDSYPFRLAIGGHRLRSNHFEVVDQGGSVEFRNGRGFGHAVGLCQWGAEGQARMGRKASQILAFYYPESRLRRAY